MRHGRTSVVNGAVHALSTAADRSYRRGARAYVALCGTAPLTPPPSGRERWRYTEEPVSCRRCLAALERLAEQALRDTAMINAMAELASSQPSPGSNRRYANPDAVRAFRRAWPLMGRAVGMLLRDRGVQLGEGWTGPTRDVRS